MNIEYENVVTPMDLDLIGQKIENVPYRCCEAFLSDIKWIVHNTKARFDRK